MGKKLSLDAYYLLKSQKKYAFQEGLSNIYYTNLANRVFSVKGTSKILFIKEVFMNFNSFYFIRKIAATTLKRIFINFKNTWNKK